MSITHEEYLAARRAANGDPAKDYSAINWLNVPDWQREEWVASLRRSAAARAKQEPEPKPATVRRQDYAEWGAW